MGSAIGWRPAVTQPALHALWRIQDPFVFVPPAAAARADVQLNEPRS